VTGRVFVVRARPGEAAELARLARECFARPWSERQFAEELGLPAPNGVLVVRALVPSTRLTPVVALCASRLVADELHVLDVAVAPEARRRGLARLLVGIALRCGARAGAHVALLEVRAGNAAALALYEALGFARAGRRREYYRDPVEDALLLERAALAELRC
jgi:ribosomal-protein-alanine N-acetyltransferase